MLPKFLTSLSNWVSIPLKSGLFFWLGGLAAWLYQAIDWGAVDQQFSGSLPAQASLISHHWQPVWNYLHHLKPEHTTLALFLLLFVMMLSNVIITRLIFPTLRLLEGYGWWQPIHEWRVKVTDRRYYEPRIQEYKLLAREHRELGGVDKLSAAKRARYRKLGHEKVYYLPIEDRLPTRLGNTLRSYERRPTQKYGLDALICWPHLWSLLPESMQKDLSAARQSLDDAVQIWLWSALCLLWIYWTWWALPIAVLLMLVAYNWAVDAAKTYGKLLETAFDLHRPLLYQALRFPLPDDPQTEVEAGENLTAYLLRGTKDGVQFRLD